MDRLPLETARWQLALLWFGGSGVLFSILVAQSFGTVYTGQLQEAWSAFLPMVLPTLSLIVSVLGSAALESDGSGKDDAVKQTTVKRSFFSITRWLSIAYLALILVSIIGQPAFVYFQGNEPVAADKALESLQPPDDSGQVSDQPSVSPVRLLTVSNLWLAPVQGLVVAAMGVLFFSVRLPGVV